MAVIDCRIDQQHESGQGFMESERLAVRVKLRQLCFEPEFIRTKRLGCSPLCVQQGGEISEDRVQHREGISLVHTGDDETRGFVRR